MNEDPVLRTEESIISDAARARRESVIYYKKEQEQNKQVNDSSRIVVGSPVQVPKKREQEFINLDIRPKPENDRVIRKPQGANQRINDGIKGRSREKVYKDSRSGHHKYKGVETSSPNQSEEILRNKKKEVSEEPRNRPREEKKKNPSEINRNGKHRDKEFQSSANSLPFSSERSYRVDNNGNRKKRSSSLGRELSKGARSQKKPANAGNNNMQVVLNIDGPRRSSLERREKQRAQPKKEKRGSKLASNKKKPNYRNKKRSAFKIYNLFALNALPFLYCCSVFLILNFFEEWIGEKEMFYTFNSFTESIFSMRSLDDALRLESMRDNPLCKNINNFSINILINTNTFLMKLYTAKKAILITNLSFSFLSLLFFWFRTTKNVNQCVKFYMGALCFIIMKPAWWIGLCIFLSAINLGLYPFYFYYVSSYNKEHSIVNYVTGLTDCFDKLNKIQTDIALNKRIFEVCTSASQILFYTMIISGIFEFHILLSCLINKFVFKIKAFSRINLC